MFMVHLVLKGGIPKPRSRAWLSEQRRIMAKIQKAFVHQCRDQEATYGGIRCQKPEWAKYVGPAEYLKT